MIRFRSLTPVVFGVLVVAGCDDPAGPGSPASVDPVSGNQQTAAVGAVLPTPLVVRVTDSRGRAVRGASVVWRVEPADGSVTPPAAETDREGRVTASWQLGTLAGPQRATAIVAGVDSVTFLATASAGQPAAAQADSGNNQLGQVGQALPQQLTVRIADAHGNPVSGALVRWRIVSGGGVANPDSSRTSAGGIASTRWTLGTLVGQQSMVAEAGTAAPATFTATAQFSPNIRTLFPEPGGLSGDSLQLGVLATSGQDIVEVTATVEGRTTSLVWGIVYPRPTLPTPAWKGAIVLTGLARGAKQVSITARDAGGATYSVAVPFVYDRLPRVSVIAPVSRSVARPSLRVAATCQDDDPDGCTRVEAKVVNSGADQVLLTGQQQIDGTVSLAAWEGRQVQILFTATDSAGQTTSSELVEVYVESSARWSEVASAGVEVWDFNADRILFVDSITATKSLKIRNRGSGSESVIYQVSGRVPEVGFLSPVGAIFTSEDPHGGAADSEIYDWRSGSRVDLGFIRYPQTLTVAGRWASWTEAAGVETRLTRRDLVAGSDVQVMQAANIFGDVAANGDVAFSNSETQDIYRYRGGIVTRLTDDPYTAFENSSPVTDGINVVYRKDPANTPTSRVAAFGASGEMLLSAPSEFEPHPRREYWTNGGWIAYMKRGTSGLQEAWLRSPAGAESRVSPAVVQIEFLGPDGEVVFSTPTGSRRYFVAPGGSPVDIGRAWNVSRFFWLDGTLHMALGRTVFRLHV